MRIEGTTAIVTGAASGLGMATAAALAKAGAKVALLDLQRNNLEKASVEVGGVPIQCDVSNAEQAQSAVDRVTRELGSPQILVNCAGIAPVGRIVGRDGPADLEMFATVVNINLIGTLNLMRLCAHAMTQLEPNEEGERGVIVNTASVAAFEGQIGQAAYAASKGGVAALTLPAARELSRHGIRVVAIAPGLFGTPMVLSMPREVQDRVTETIPFPSRFGRPSEYADLALHILKNPMLNGEVIRLDGALRMQAR